MADCEVLKNQTAAVGEYRKHAWEKLRKRERLLVIHKDWTACLINYSWTRVMLKWIRMNEGRRRVKEGANQNLNMLGTGH